MEEIPPTLMPKIRPESDGGPVAGALVQLQDGSLILPMPRRYEIKARRRWSLGGD